MSGEVSAREQLVELPHQRVGEAAGALVAIATAAGYSIAATGPGTYRLARSRRKMVFGRSDESLVVSVFEDRAGTKARFVGDLDPALVTDLAAREAAPASASAPAPAAGQVRRPQATAPPPQTYQPPPQHSSTPVQASVQPPAQIAQVPIRQGPTHVTSSNGSAPSHAPPVLLSSSPPPDGHRRAQPVRSAWPTSAASPVGAHVAGLPSVGAALSLGLPDGRTVMLDAPLVIGRNPELGRGPSRSVAIAIDDRSLSKTHLLVEPDGARARVTDLHSTNGTSLVDGSGRQLCTGGAAIHAEPGTTLLAGSVELSIGGRP